mmetsp:Transcript_8192/g.22817  ORF Transcript_8192/g.22817 Transcript_8192/m.22817 type:complete len:283 (-) Transcript_8192:281-1129(-)
MHENKHPIWKSVGQRVHLPHGLHNVDGTAPTPGKLHGVPGNAPLGGARRAVGHEQHPLQHEEEGAGQLRLRRCRRPHRQASRTRRPVSHPGWSDVVQGLAGHGSSTTVGTVQGIDANVQALRRTSGVVIDLGPDRRNSFLYPIVSVDGPHLVDRTVHVPPARVALGDGDGVAGTEAMEDAVGVAQRSVTVQHVEDFGVRLGRGAGPPALGAVPGAGPEEAVVGEAAGGVGGRAPVGGGAGPLAREVGEGEVVERGVGEADATSNIIGRRCRSRRRWSGGGGP